MNKPKISHSLKTKRRKTEHLGFLKFLFKIPVSTLVKFHSLFFFSGFIIILSTMYDELFFTNGKTEFQEKFEVQEGENNCKTLVVLAKVSVQKV